MSTSPTNTTATSTPATSTPATSTAGPSTAIRRWLLLIVSFLAFTYVWSDVHVPSYEPKPITTAAQFEAYLEQTLTRSRALGVLEPFQERLVRRAPGKTPVALLYIHGFGASRGEGEAVVERLGEALGANTYYLRLPGHGESMEAHAKVPYQAYLDLAREALEHMPLLGERVVVIGCSTGGLLATYLAATMPDKVQALILASPFYAFSDPSSFALQVPGGIYLIEALYGEIRDAGWKSDPEQRKGPDYERHWMTRQRYRALLNLSALRQVAARESLLARVSAPTLLLYYYVDEAHQDRAASVPAMQEAFAIFGRDSSRSPLNELVAIPDGNHILLSEHVRTDKARVLETSLKFLQRVGFSPVRPEELLPPREGELHAE